jgi:hypothetical protein
MNALERKEFFYARTFNIVMGGCIVLMGAICALGLGHMLGLDVPFADSIREALFPEEIKLPTTRYGYVLYALLCAVLLAGSVMMAAGLYFMSKGLDGRPVVVVYSEGLYYRPLGDAIVPWRDIRAVEFEQGDEGTGRAILTRQSGPPVKINLNVLQYWGFPGPNNPVYQAILQAWERPGRKA